MSTLDERLETFTTEEPEAGEAWPEHAGHGYRSLFIAIAALAALLIGAVVWSMRDYSAAPTGAAEGEAEQLVDDYIEAWNSRDSDAFIALVTENFVIRFADDSVVTADTQANSIERSAATYWSIDPVSDSIVSGDGPWYVAQVNHLDSSALQAGGVECTSVFTVVDDAGELHVARHDLFGQF